MHQVIRNAAQPRAQHRQGRDQRPLPQRPGHGRGQQPGRRRGRRRAGRVHDQRPRRAGRQLLAGGGRHGPADPPRLLSGRHPRRHPPPGPHQPPGGQHHRHAGAAQQGDRRPERLRPRGGHPPGRHAQGTHHLRDHAARGRRLRHHRPGAGQAQRPGRAGQSHQGAGLHAQPASSSRPVFEQFKVLADKKKEIYDADLAALVEQEIRAVRELWSLVVVPGDRRHGQGAGGHAAAASRRGGVQHRAWPAATARWTRSSWPSRS